MVIVIQFSVKLKCPDQQYLPFPYSQRETAQFIDRKNMELKTVKRQTHIYSQNTFMHNNSITTVENHWLLLHDEHINYQVCD